MNKNIDTFARWGMPGWSAIIGFLIFVLVDYLSANNSTMYNKINGVFVSDGIWQLTIAALLIAGAGIPLGFIIYQLYFYLRWNSPVSEDGLLPPLIVGRHAELDDTLQTLSIKDIALDEEWRKKLLPEGSDHRSIWLYMGPFLVDTLIKADASNTVYDRHSYLMNMLHALGASHLGIIIGYSSYLLLKWKLGQSELWWMAVSFFVALIVVILLSKEDFRNHDKGSKLFGVLIIYPAEVFIASLVLIYFVTNPALNTLFPYQLPWILCAGIAFLWGYSVKKGRAFLSVVFIVSSGIAFAFKLLLPRILLQANWPAMLSILIFCGLSLIYLKNRQNTREQLAAFEYYYIQKFILNQQKQLRTNYKKMYLRQ